MKGVKHLAEARQCDFSKLKGKIVEKYGTQQVFAEHINYRSSRVSNVLNNKAGLTKEEIITWCNALDIETRDIGVFFFDIQSHKCENV